MAAGWVVNNGCESRRCANDVALGENYAFFSGRKINHNFENLIILLLFFSCKINCAQFVADRKRPQASAIDVDTKWRPRYDHRWEMENWMNWWYLLNHSLNPSSIVDGRRQTHRVIPVSAPSPSPSPASSLSLSYAFHTIANKPFGEPMLFHTDRESIIMILRCVLSTLNRTWTCTSK